MSELRRRLSSAVLTAAMAVGLATSGATASSAETVTGEIGGAVWFDRNPNRVWENGEPGRAGALVTARNKATNVDYTAVTDQDGWFRITALPLGIYQVSTSSAGYRAVTSDSFERPVEDSRPGFEYFPLVGARVSGRAWADANGDGIGYQRGEPPVDTQFTVVGQSDHEGWISRTVTSVGGDYVVHDIPSGTYTVQTVAPAGMTITQYHAGPWYADSDFTGTPLATEPFSVSQDQYQSLIDAGFVTS